MKKSKRAKEQKKIRLVDTAFIRIAAKSNIISPCCNQKV